MGNQERNPTWPQIRDALEVSEGRLLSVWLTESFATKKVTRESDVDVVLVLETYEAIDEFGLVEILLG